MREYEQEVREQYEIEIKSTRRTRGAFFCIGNADTEVFLMKETLASEKRAALLYLTLNRLEKTGKLKVDAPVFSRDGKLIVAARDGTRYMMKKWYSGRECDMKKEQELLLAAEKLGILHTHLKWQEPTAGELETLLCKYAVRSEDAAVSGKWSSVRKCSGIGKVEQCQKMQRHREMEQYQKRRRKSLCHSNNSRKRSFRSARLLHAVRWMKCCGITGK